MDVTYTVDITVRLRVDLPENLQDLPTEEFHGAVLEMLKERTTILGVRGDRHGGGQIESIEIEDVGC